MPRATGHENILLVDDEEVIIQLESRMLERLGYRVTSCSNGAEAMAVFSENPEAFDLVLTDMNMPSMTGDQLAREIIAIRPDIPIIICTGFSEKIGRDEARAIGVKGFLMKPVSVMEVAHKVRKVLDGELEE
jgi:CheY-like chemotaxis protein